MKLSAFPARVDTRRKVSQERQIENAMSKCTVQLRGVDAHNPGRESIANESSSKFGGVETPDRKDWLKTCRTQQPLAIGAVTGDAGQEARNFNLRISPERERAVFAATPAEKNLFSHHPNRSLATPIAPFNATMPRLVRITGQFPMTIP